MDNTNHLICFIYFVTNVCTKTKFIEAMEGVEEGIKVGGKLLEDVRFADVQGMVADTESSLQKIMERLSATAEDYRMKI